MVWSYILLWKSEAILVIFCCIRMSASNIEDTMLSLTKKKKTLCFQKLRKYIFHTKYTSKYIKDILFQKLISLFFSFFHFICIPLYSDIEDPARQNMHIKLSFLWVRDSQAMAEKVLYTNLLFRIWNFHITSLISYKLVKVI